MKYLARIFDKKINKNSLQCCFVFKNKNQQHFLEKLTIFS